MLRPALHARFTITAITIAALLLTGCMGGPIAQQIASSIATRVADKVVGDAVDEQLRKEREPRHIDLMNTEPDPYLSKFLFSQFAEPEQPQMIIEPLPSNAGQVDAEPSNGQPRANSSRLVSVELLNLIIGQEKQAMLERSLQKGSTVLPTPIEWRDWQLATGNLQGHAESQLYVLIPPSFGRIRSGDLAVVEIASVGGVHIARYRAN
jgi:hypothetical protein